MRKVAMIIMSLLLTLVFVLGTTSVVLASGEKPTLSAQSLKPALILKAPEITYVGEVTLTSVFESSTGKPVAKAAVWALDTAMMTSGTIYPDDLARSAASFGQLLGYTNDEGIVRAIFKQPGLYYLVAIKDGFIPAVAKITVKLQSMYIKAPEMAWVGQQVTIGVYKTNSVLPVGGAAVWAVDTCNALATTNSLDKFIQITMKNGFFVGYTDRSGLVRYRFTKPGDYYLVAIRDGYIPAIAKISIRSFPITSVNPEASSTVNTITK